MIESYTTCETCKHDFILHETKGIVTGSYYCREKDCSCRAYVMVTKQGTKPLLCPNCEETLGTVIVTVSPLTDISKVELTVAVSCTEETQGKFTHSDIKVEKVDDTVIKVYFVEKAKEN